MQSYMNLDDAIYNRFYVQAKKDNFIWILSDFVTRHGLVDSDESDDFDIYSIPVIKDHGKAIQDVLSLEITLYIFRNLNGTWGEVVDNLRNQLYEKINNYRELTGYQIITGNELV